MNSRERIVISGLGSISPLGADWASVVRSYDAGRSAITSIEREGRAYFAAPLSVEAESELRKEFEGEELERLDRSVLIARYAARGAVRTAQWQKDSRSTGVSIGSARGATDSVERAHRAYLSQPSRRLPARTSPSTTLGNLASWVAQDVGATGVAMSHSSTCTSGLVAVANGMAWLRAGLCERFVAGGSEGALTAFTLAQLEALGIYSKGMSSGAVCRPCAEEQENSFVLGEGAACVALEFEADVQARGHTPRAVIEGCGVAVEPLSSPTSISAEGEVFYRAMKSAIVSAGGSESFDAVILHAPGTVQGDEAELKAVMRLFDKKPPCLTSNKWLLGHTLGASGVLSIEYAIYLMERGALPRFPYPARVPQQAPDRIRRVLVNSAGFGGQAVSVIVSQYS